MQQFIVLCVVEIMSAIKLNTRWNEDASGRSLPIFPRSQNVFSRIGVKPHEHHCPSCDSIVYSRRHRRCGVCELVLPKSLLFTRNEAEQVDELLRIERQRHRNWMTRGQS